MNASEKGNELQKSKKKANLTYTEIDPRLRLTALGEENFNHADSRRSTLAAPFIDDKLINLKHFLRGILAGDFFRKAAKLFVQSLHNF